MPFHKLLISGVVLAFCWSSNAVLAQAVQPAMPKQAARSAPECIKFEQIRGAKPPDAIGIVTNVCDSIVGAVIDFGIDAFGKPVNGRWCQNRAQDDFYLHGALMFDPGERKTVGFGLSIMPKKVNWASCIADTTKNNSVYFTVQEPHIKINSDCSYECR